MMTSVDFHRLLPFPSIPFSLPLSPTRYFLQTVQVHSLRHHPNTSKNWFGGDLTKWQGVQTTPDGLLVTRLTLHDNNLTGGFSKVQCVRWGGSGAEVRRKLGEEWGAACVGGVLSR